MSTLALVRHGQASLFADDYDKLSPLGEEQSSLLGEHWARAGARWDAIYTGTLRRQVRTAELAAEAMARAGSPCPAPIALPEFNEYDADNVMKRLLPELARADARLRGLSAALDASADGRERYRNFHRLLEAVMGHWVEGASEPGGYETWAQFSGRVREGLRRATEGAAPGRRVAIFTSGGPIGAMVQTVLRAPDSGALDLNWRIRNASITEIVFSPGRMTLDLFNAIPHLAEPRLWTYR